MTLEAFKQTKTSTPDGCRLRYVQIKSWNTAASEEIVFFF
jgi:hypothetical protein